MGSKSVVLVEDILRHAIYAAKIAAIADRNAQVAQRTCQRIDDHAGWRFQFGWDQWNRVQHAMVGDGDGSVGHDAVSVFAGRFLSLLPGALPQAGEGTQASTQIRYHEPRKRTGEDQFDGANLEAE